MYVYLEIASGPELGQLYRARPNMRIGSGDCEVRLQDPELPNVHSQIMYDGENQMVLVCTNAVYEIFINNKTVKKVVLEDGLVLRLGGSSLRVIISNRPLSGSLDPLRRKSDEETGMKESGGRASNQASRIKTLEEESPKYQLLKQLKELKNRAKNGSPNLDMRLFKSPLHLRLLSGPQADDEYIISWGPREFGPMALEFPIDFPPFPGVLFTLTPSPSGDVIFSTNHSDFARVHGKTESTCVIKEGDKIEAGNSTILVELLRERDESSKD